MFPRIRRPPVFLLGFGVVFMVGLLGLWNRSGTVWASPRLVVPPSPTVWALPDTTLRLVTAPNRIPAHNEFYTFVYVDGIPAPGLGSWQAQIAYGSSIMQFVKIYWGQALGSTGRTVIPFSNASVPGKLLLGATTLPGPDGVTGNGIHLATIRWRATHRGRSDLLLAPDTMQRLIDVHRNLLGPAHLQSSWVQVTTGPTPVLPQTHYLPIFRR